MPISTAVTHPSPVTVVVAAWLAVGGSWLHGGCGGVGSRWSLNADQIW
uniref:Uncharacterized protein n=1 Tax=Fagus sylvatica TaxID=28930 RepID=A0A2N9ICH1_FAGSY